MIALVLPQLLLTLAAPQASSSGALQPALTAAASTAPPAPGQAAGSHSGGSGPQQLTTCIPDWVPTFGANAGSIFALLVHDDGSGGGPALYAGGSFTSIGGVAANRIAKWDGTSWSPLGSGMSSTVHTLVVHDDGSGAGPALYAGGQFVIAGGVTVGKVARWDGTAWSALGGGITTSSSTSVRVLVTYDDGLGGGPALFAVGTFSHSSSSSPPANNVAKWDGVSWSQVGAGVNGLALTAAVFDDGSGPALYVGGDEIHFGGPEGAALVRWDGTAWARAGLVSFYPMSGPLALQVFDDGSGPALYAGGAFALDIPGSWPFATLARWDGVAWSIPGAPGPNTAVLSLGVFDDGSGGGPALYAGGIFTTAGGVAANRIAKWDGAAWSALGAGLNGPPRALTEYDDGSGAASLIVGGEFTSSPSGDSPIAAWRGCDTGPGSDFCFGDGSGTACPCGNAGGAGRGCANSTGLGARLRAKGTDSLTANDLVLRGENMPSGQVGVLLAGVNALNGGSGIHFGDGLRCVGGSLQRLGVRNVDAQGTASWGPGLGTLGGWVSGETRHFQLWFRDPLNPLPCEGIRNTSNAYAIDFGP